MSMPSRTNVTIEGADIIAAFDQVRANLSPVPSRTAATTEAIRLWTERHAEKAKARARQFAGQF